MTRTYTVQDFGPSDLLTSAVEGERRAKVAIDPELSRAMLANINPFGESLSAEYTPIVERKPLPRLSVIRDRIVGAGTVTIDNGEKLIDGTLGLTSLYTRDFGRYLPGVFGLAGIGINLADMGSGSAEFGYGNGAGNRMGMRRDTDGTLRTFVESDGVRYYDKPRSEWIDPLDGTGASGATVELERFVLRMVIGWYGYLSIAYYVAVHDRINGDRLYLIDRSEAPASGINIEQPDLPVFAEATGGQLRVGGMQYGVYGRYNPQFRITGEFASKASVGTTFVPLISYRVKQATNWRGVNVQLSGDTVLSTADADTAIIIGGTLTGASFGSLSGISADETALEVDTAATAISGGYRAFTDNVGGGQGNQSGSRGTDIPSIQIPRDSIVTLAVRSLSATTDVRGTLRLKEEW